MIEKYETEGVRFSFVDFLEISEGVLPKPVKFSAFSVDSDGTYFSRIDSPNGKYVVFIEPSAKPNTCDVAFAALKPDGNPLILSPENYTMSEPTPSKNAIAAFGEVLWVLFRFAESHPKFTRFRFTGGYKKIGEFYRVLLSNSRFLETLKINGFEVDEPQTQKYGNIFVIKKIT